MKKEKKIMVEEIEVKEIGVEEIEVKEIGVEEIEVKEIEVEKVEEIVEEKSAEEKIADLENKVKELEEKLEELVGKKKTISAKPKKSRDVTEEDVLKIAEGKKKGISVKELMAVIDLTYGQIYSVYNGYTFTSISKIAH